MARDTIIATVAGKAFRPTGRPTSLTRPVFYLVGLLLIAEGVAMLIPSVVDAAAGNPDWQIFAGSAAITVFCGASLYLTCRGEPVVIRVKQAFLLTTFSWVALSAFGALPFLLYAPKLSLADAVFEAVSGLTTTGSTVLVGLDAMPPGILLWRALLQWIGGIGIIVLAVAVLPYLGVGGMQLFRTEASDRSDKILPRPGQIATAIAIVYVTASIACATCYWLAGMTVFEAAVHAMTTVSTGGYSTSDGSLGHFANPAIEWTAVLFMLVGAVPFILLIRMVREQSGSLFREGQVRMLIVGILVSGSGAAIWLHFYQGIALAEGFRLAIFNITSVITTTGYATSDYQLWGNAAMVAFFFLTLVGGCTGSTAGGIKMFRFQIVYVALRMQFHRLIFPHGMFPPTYGHRVVGDDVISSVLAFLFMYLLTLVAATVALALAGLDFVTSISGAATALSNVGPGLGPVIGPAGNFAPLPDVAKWILAGLMLLGRLELFTAIVLLSPRFWRS